MHKYLGSNVHSQVSNGESCPLHHHGNQVLTQVVQVTLDGPNQYLPLGDNIPLLKEGLEQFGALLHRFSRAQHLGDKYQTLGIPLPHLIHGGNQPLIQNIVGILARIQGILCLRYRCLDVTLDYRSRQGIKFTHLYPP